MFARIDLFKTWTPLKTLPMVGHSISYGR